MKLVQFDPSAPVRRAHEHECRPDILQADEPIHCWPLDDRRSLHLKTECQEERLHGLEVVDDDEGVVHA